MKEKKERGEWPGSQQMVAIVRVIYRTTEEQQLLTKNNFFQEFCDIINHISKLQMLCDIT